jgi:hypothetical protein
MNKLIRDTVALNTDTKRFTSALSALTRFSRRQERLEHPEGTFDNAGRFYPSDSEDCGVSSYIRTPSRSYPHSYMLACRTLDHCERLEDADHDDVLLLRRFFKSMEIDTSDKRACLAAIVAVVPQAVAEARATRALSKSKVLPAMPDAGRARARA